jgi:FAD binding domain
VLSDNSFQALGESLRGELIQPDDQRYDTARKLYNGMIDRWPRAIARCADVSDVITAVGFAREHELLLAVRGGGHNGDGLGSCDDGLVIDLSRMKGVRVDPARRTARVEGGCNLGRCRSRNAYSRAGNAQRYNFNHRRWWTHAGRGARAPDAQVRSCHRQPNRRRSRSRQKRANYNLAKEYWDALHPHDG